VHQYSSKAFKSDIKNTTNNFTIWEILTHNFKDFNNTKQNKQINKTRGVSHCGLAIYIKTYFKAKEKL
jgi:hypothetical protein